MSFLEGDTIRPVILCSMCTHCAIWEVCPVPGAHTQNATSRLPGLVRSLLPPTTLTAAVTGKARSDRSTIWGLQQEEPALGTQVLFAAISYKWLGLWGRITSTKHHYSSTKAVCKADSTAQLSLKRMRVCTRAPVTAVQSVSKEL